MEYWQVVHAKVASLEAKLGSTAGSSKQAEELGAALACLNQLLREDDGDDDDQHVHDAEAEPPHLFEIDRIGAAL